MLRPAEKRLALGTHLRWESSHREMQTKTMSTKHVLAFFYSSMAALIVFTGADVARGEILKQSDSRERFGAKDFEYFFIEAEDFHDNDPAGAGASFLLSSDEEALASSVNDGDTDPDTGELIEPDPGAFASGGESITNAVFNSLASDNIGGSHDIQYLLEFDAPGTYYMYIRHHSPVGPELNRNQNDSFYYPDEFGSDPFQLKANGDDYGILESIEGPDDVAQRGPWIWFAARDEVEGSEQDPPVDQNTNRFVEFVITESMVGDELELEFDHRETGVMLDAFLFIETGSGLPPTSGLGPDGLGFFGIGDLVDMEFGLENLGSATTGDPNDCSGDGTVDIEDTLCAMPDTIGDVLTAANLLAGDADGNGTVEFADFLTLSSNFGQEGNFKQGNFDLVGGVAFADFLTLSNNFGQSAANLAAVPEPTANHLLGFGFVALIVRRRALVRR